MTEPYSDAEIESIRTAEHGVLREIVQRFLATIDQERAWRQRGGALPEDYAALKRRLEFVEASVRADHADNLVKFATSLRGGRLDRLTVDDLRAAAVSFLAPTSAAAEAAEIELLRARETLLANAVLEKGEPEVAADAAEYRAAFRALVRAKEAAG